MQLSLEAYFKDTKWYLFLSLQELNKQQQTCDSSKTQQTTEKHDTHHREIIWVGMTFNKFWCSSNRMNLRIYFLPLPQNHAERVTLLEEEETPSLPYHHHHLVNSLVMTRSFEGIVSVISIHPVVVVVETPTVLHTQNARRRRVQQRDDWKKMVRTYTLSTWFH